jgi:monoterpene epsilon-lactone hydrolase
MASWQTHLATWLIKLTFKQRMMRARFDVRRMRNVMTPLPFRIPRGVTITPAEIGGIDGEWVDAGSASPTLLYIHGGGYFACSAQTHRAVTVGFAKQGLRVFALNYRRAPEHRFPAALDDVLAVYRGLLQSGIAPSQLFVAGESAGGGLTLSLLVALLRAGDPLPAAAAVFSPWTDLAVTGDSIRRNNHRCAMFTADSVRDCAPLYLGDADPRDPLASPLYAEYAGCPPLLVHVGADEVLLDDSVRLAERARAAGVTVDLKIWPVVAHAWQLGYPFVPEAGQSIAAAASFLKAHAAGRAAGVLAP